METERKIGEIFEFGGEWYQCVEGETICSECDLRNIICQRDTSINNPFKECSGNYRTDKKNIIFKKLEKVGEPYKFNGHLFQSYRTFEVPIFTENYATVRRLGNNSKISIEIKQIEEDMEEKGEMTLDDAIKHYDEVGKHSISKECTLKNFQVRDWLVELKKYKEKECFNSKSIGMNLREFDIEAAKAGKPVCTRDGRKARIICFDAKFPKTGNIVTLVEKENGEEVTLYHYDDGHCSIGRGYDLMMFTEKRSGWVNVYNNPTTHNIYTSADVFESKEIAEEQGTQRNRIATCKISWEK